MSTCYIEIESGLKMTQEQLIQRAKRTLVSNPRKFLGLAKVFSVALNNQTENASKLESIIAEAKKKLSSEYLGVSKMVDAKHKLHDAIDAPHQLLVPEFDTENYIRNYIKDRQTSGKAAADLEKEIRMQLSNDQFESVIGTMQHALIEALFKTNGDTRSLEFEQAKVALRDAFSKKSEDGEYLDESRKTLYEIITQESSKDVSQEKIINALVKNAVNVYKSITERPEYQGAKFYSECDLYADNVKMPDIHFKGIKGIADLIVVKQDGSIDIIDFKVAATRMSQWCDAKFYHTEYQEGFYRAMLAAHGFDGSKIGIYTQPIFFNKYDGLDTEVDGPMVNMLSMSSRSASPWSHLDWQNGIFTNNIKYLVNYSESMTTAESIEAESWIEEQFVQMIDYRPNERNYSKEKLAELIKERIDSKTNKKVYSFFDQIQKQWIEFPYKEDFTRDGGFFDKYMQKMNNYRTQAVLDVIQKIQEYKSNGINPEKFDFFNQKRTPGSASTALSHIFGEFTKSYYEVLDFPILIQYGILGIKNTITNTIHFVVITDQNLSATYADGKYGTVLGNFISNDQIRTEDRLSVLPATCQNAELLKAMHIINSIAEIKPDFFKDNKVGSIQIVNPLYKGENNVIPLEQLIQNYNRLCEFTHVKNHFNGDIRKAQVWEEFGSQLTWLAETTKEDDPELSNVISKFQRKNKNLTVRQKIQALKDLRQALVRLYPNRYTVRNFKDAQHYNFSDPIDHVFIITNQLIAELLEIPLDPSGNYDKYGLHFSSVIELLSIPFISNQAMVDKSGKRLGGIANGLYTTSAENSPSPTLKALGEYYEIAYSHVREEFQEAQKSISKITLPYINAHISKMSRVFNGTSTDLWEKLLEKDSSGKISARMRLQDPYSDHCTLTLEEKEFLKGILWEINKYLHADAFEQYRHLNYKDNKAEIDRIIRSREDPAISKIVYGHDGKSGTYFNLPLKRARYFQRWKKVKRANLTSLLQKELETLRDDWDPSKMHATQRSQVATILGQDATTMYNQYELSEADREYLIQEEGIENFELDLDLLAMDVAFQSIRKVWFEDVLQTTAAVATVLHVNQQLTGTDRGAELEALADRTDSAIKNQSIVDKEMDEPSKGFSALRKLNSLLVLAFRPLQFLKEITFGQFTNYSRVFSTKGSSEKLSAKSVFNANTTIWGQSIGKWAGVFSGNTEMASFTLAESLNKIYSIANEDINRTSEGSSNSRFGVLGNVTHYMYLPSSAPDYFNRLTLFIAKMMEDGCWEAHSLDENGNLVYDFKKDKRFSELNKHGLNSNYTGKEYLEQKALYLAMAEQFAKEGRDFITYDKEGNVVYKEFDRAYTNKERDSIKEVADLAYGYYDHETKSLLDLGFFGLVYRQFQTFLTAKTNLWLKGRPITKGSNTNQGRFKPVMENGEFCYKRITKNENGNLQVELVKESDLRPEEKGVLTKAYQWQGDYVEGLCYSIMGTLNSLFHGKLSEITGDSELAKYRRANLALAMHDILIGIILFSIFKWLFSEGTKKMQDIKPLQRTMLRAMQDVSPSAITSWNWEPGFYTTLVNLRENAVKIFSDEDADIEKMLRNQIGAIKDWTYNDRD